MRQLFFISLFISTLSFGQVNDDGSPRDFTDEIESIDFDNFSLKVNYLSIKNNVQNKDSSLHFWDNPTIENYVEWALIIYSYEFVAYRNNEFYMKISLSKNTADEKPTFMYSLVKPGLGQYNELPCTVEGEITEMRANELIENNYDKGATIKEIDSTSTISINEERFEIQPYNAVKNEVIDIIKMEINKEETKNNKIAADPIGYIKKESIGGELDFSKILVGYGEKDPEEKVYLYSIALWSGAVKQLGVSDIEQIIKLWEEIHQQKANKKIKHAIKYGFSME